MLNQSILVGRIVKEPEIRETENEKAFHPHHRDEKLSFPLSAVPPALTQILRPLFRKYEKSSFQLHFSYLLAVVSVGLRTNLLSR